MQMQVDFYLTPVAKLSTLENKLIYFQLIPQILRKRLTSIYNEAVQQQGRVINKKEEEAVA